MGAPSPLAEPRAGLRRPSRPLRTPRARERGHPGSRLSASREPSGASSLRAGQTPRGPAPAVLDWTERSPEGAEPGECRVRAEGSRRPPIPPTLANELGLARRRLGLPEPGSPVASERRARRTLASYPPRARRGLGEIFLAPFPRTRRPRPLPPPRCLQGWF